MCLRAAPHVDVTTTFKQFAIFLLQRDDFDGSPKWHSGDAKVSVCLARWAQVREIWERLRSERRRGRKGR